MSRDIITQLKKLRIEPRAGYVGEEVRARGREKLMEAITGQQEQTIVWAPAATFEFMRFTFSDLLAKPVTALASFAVLVLGGLTTVSAASQSLPGDTLYGVKIVSERAQLQLTGSDKKAVLHTEFAERRLQELVELTNSETPDQALMASTVDAFKFEVSSATQEIQNLQTTQSGQLLAQVSEVNAKMVQFTDSLAATPIMDEPAITQDMQDATQGATQTVVDTVVEAHEKTPEPASGRELTELLQDRMNKMVGRRTFGIGRIEVIESSKAFYSVTSRAEIGALKLRLRTVSNQIADATELAVAGGYRKAFEIMREVEVEMSAIENALADIEIKLIEKNQAPASEIVPPVVSPEAPSPTDGTQTP